MSLFGAGCPALGKPRGMRSCGMLFRFEPRLESSSLKSPFFIASEYVRVKKDPVSTFCRCTSKAAKKNSRSLFLV